MKEDTNVKIIDSQKIYHNGLANAVKSVVYDLEPEMFEMAKQVDENTSVVVELKLIKNGNGEGMEDPFEKVGKKNKK